MKAAFANIDAEGVHWHVADTSVPELGAGQLLVRVEAACLNRGESFLMQDQLRDSGGRTVPTRAGGLDAAGVVVGVGTGAGGEYKIGDRVAGRCAGGFAEFAVLNTFEAMAVPDGVSAAEAACLPISYVVAHDALMVNGGLSAQSRVLVTGVSSGVGVASLLISKHVGAMVIGTSGSADKLARLMPLGLDLGIRTRAPDYAARVLEATGGCGADILVDNVGGAFFAANLEALATEGRLVTVGRMGGLVKPVLDLDRFAMKRLHLYGVSNRLRTAAQRAASMRRFVADLMPAFARRAIVPLVDRVFGLDEVAQAHAQLNADTHVGKLVLQIAAPP